MKIGILTYHRAPNYGAFLQAYGLCMRLNEEPDLEAEIIDFRMRKEDDFYANRNYPRMKMLRQFLWRIRHIPKYRFKEKLKKSFCRGLRQMPLSGQTLCSDSVEDFEEFVRDRYDVIIAGSDEIWKVDGYRGFPTPYWLPGDLGCVKLSYAASSRSDFSKLNDSTLQQIRSYLNDFSYLSVRDELTRGSILKYIQPSAAVGVYPDPSFVYDYHADGERGRSLLADRAGLDPEKPIALVMLEDPAAAEQIRKELADDYQLTAVFSRHRGYRNLHDLDPFEWLDAIAGADLVCASYFHAVCFSIVCGTPFLAIGADDKVSKLKEVVEASGNGARLLPNDTTLYKEGYLGEKAREFSSACGGSEYTAACRERFGEYVKLIRTLEKDPLHRRGK